MAVTLFRLQISVDVKPLTIDFPFIDTTIVGYVTNLSPVKTSKGSIERKYFTFDMDTYGNKERTFCFSSEKHLLINKIEENGKACELKRFKRSDTNDVFITDCTSLKEVEPQFLKSDMQAEFVTTATILNEKAKNDIINAKGLIYSLMPIESSTKDPTFTLRTAKLSDNTGNIQITVFTSLVTEIKEDYALSFTYMRVSRFQSDRLIKSRNKR